MIEVLPFQPETTPTSPRAFAAITPTQAIRERRASHPHETQQQTADAVLQSKNSQTVGAVLRKVGRPKAGEGNGANSTFSRGGTQAAYLAARLRRDHPAAEFDESVRGSVRQAAITRAGRTGQRAAARALAWIAG